MTTTKASASWVALSPGMVGICCIIAPLETPDSIRNDGLRRAWDLSACLSRVCLPTAHAILPGPQTSAAQHIPVLLLPRQRPQRHSHSVIPHRQKSGFAWQSVRERRRNRMPSKMTHGPRTHPLKIARAHAPEAEYPFCWNANTAQPGEDKPFVQFGGNALQFFVCDGATDHGQ